LIDVREFAACDQGTLGFARARVRERTRVRILAIGLAIAVIVFVLTAGHVLFLPLLFIPFGLFGFGHRRRNR
jgi:uncharacterized membrane protein YccC